MNRPYTPIQFNISASNCPVCGAYTQIVWYPIHVMLNGWREIGGLHLGRCQHCFEFTIWRNNQMVYPIGGNVPIANSDLPEDILQDYNEASDILNLSPRGAAAILRLAVQKLCKALCEKGDNINTDIKNLVSKGLPAVMQQALDSVRVVGNNAVHPGQIDLTDDVETALKLFGFINIIAHTLITQPKQIGEFYTAVVPEKDKTAIQKRDSLS